MQCPKCKYHEWPIWAFYRDPETNKPWYVRECPRPSCQWHYDILSEPEYLASYRKNKGDNGLDIQRDYGRW